MAIRKSFKGERFSIELASEIVPQLERLIAADKLFVGGSYIRGRRDIGDLDIAVLKNSDTQNSIDLLVKFWNGEVLVSGPAQTRLVLEYPGQPGFKFQVDIWFAQNEGQFGPLSMFVAGSGMFNVIQRSQAAKQGYCLGQTVITNSTTKLSAGDFPTEQSVYDFFGWQWIPYSQRNK
jgi:DNA polymerase/3'-5' exonuclease PolX